MQAYSIDTKLDDGIATTGKVLAQYNGGYFAAPVAATNANPDTSTTCYNSSTKQYSTKQNGGRNINCSLSFKIQ